jgi:hypothetical protein
MVSKLPQYYLDDSRAPTIQGVMWTMAIVPLVFVLMRLYVRVALRRVFGWDDFIIIIALVSTQYPVKILGSVGIRVRPE